MFAMTGHRCGPLCFEWIAFKTSSQVTEKKKQKRWREGNSLYLLLNVHVSVDCNSDLLLRFLSIKVI